MKNLSKIVEKFFNLCNEDGDKNNDQLINELTNLKSFENRIEFAEKHYEKLGEGSSRTIFRLSDSLVLKVAYNDKGIAQNKAEIAIHSPCLNNVLAADTDGKWIIVRFTETLTEKDFKNIIGVGFEIFGNALHYKTNNEQHEGKPHDYDDIVKLPLFKCIINAIVKFDLQAGDVAKISSWGKLENRPVLRDFGLTKDIFIKHYKDKDSSSGTKSTEKSKS